MLGAGKTRAEAAIISGLITKDPSLKIMILTEKNVASQAFAEHIMGLSLPSWIDFFSCIADRARDIVGQLLEIRNEVKPN